MDNLKSHIDYWHNKGYFMSFQITSLIKKKNQS